MAAINIPDKICSHCNGTKWYKITVKDKSSNEKIVYRCVKRVLDINKKSNCEESRKKALDKYRKTDRFKSVQVSYYKKNKEKIIKRSKNWRLKNRDRYNKCSNKCKKLYIDSLNDYYVKNLLTKRTPDLNSSDIPTELINIKRKQLLLKRQIA